VFVKVDKRLKMDVNDVKKKITKNTIAIIVTYIFGFPCDIKKILYIAKKNNIYLIEDCSHAIGLGMEGKKVGSFGDFSIFSFNMWKLVNCFGGGAIASNNYEVITKIRNEIKMYKLDYFNLYKKIAFNYLC